MENVYRILSKQLFHPLWFVELLFYLLLLFMLAFGQSNSSPGDSYNNTAVSLAAFLSTPDPIMKKRMLKNLSSQQLHAIGTIQKVTTRDKLDRNEIDEILKASLNEKRPTVVAEGIRQCATTRSANMVPRLIALYHEAPNRFHGYAERVQIEVIQTLGSLGGEKALQFVLKELKADNGTSMGSFFLKALKKMNDPACLQEVVSYAERMEAIVAKIKSANVNPLLYSTYMQNGQLARAIEFTLTEKEGKHE